MVFCDVRAWLRIVLLSSASNAIALLPACSQGSLQEKAARRAAPIIGGQPATELADVAVVDHRDRSERCSGTLIARTQVLTARHCVFTRSSDPPVPLATDGFRVGFGSSDASLTRRYVEDMSWPGMDADVPLDAALEGGEDVAMLRLSEPAPCDITPRAVDVDYQPTTTDTLALAGFGVSSLDTGTHGVRRVGNARPAGLDAQTGLLQLEGDAACFGDSGGPVLLRREGAAQVLVGVLSEVGGSSANRFCDVGTSFAVSVVNSNVRAFLRNAISAASGQDPCPRQDAGKRMPDAATPDRARPRAKANHIAASTTAPTVPRDASADTAAPSSSGRGCRVSRHGHGSPSCLLPASVVVLAWARRKRPRVTSGNFG